MTTSGQSSKDDLPWVIKLCLFGIVVTVGATWFCLKMIVPAEPMPEPKITNPLKAKHIVTEWDGPYFEAYSIKIDGKEYLVVMNTSGSSIAVTPKVE